MAARRGLPKTTKTSMKYGAMWTTRSRVRPYRNQWVRTRVDHGTHGGMESSSTERPKRKQWAGAFQIAVREGGKSWGKACGFTSSTPAAAAYYCLFWVICRTSCRCNAKNGLGPIKALTVSAQRALSINISTKVCAGGASTCDSGSTSFNSQGILGLKGRISISRFE